MSNFDIDIAIDDFNRRHEECRVSVVIFKKVSWFCIYLKAGSYYLFVKKYKTLEGCTDFIEGKF